MKLYCPVLAALLFDGLLQRKHNTCVAGIVIHDPDHVSSRLTRSRGFREVLNCSTISGPPRPRTNSAPRWRSIPGSSRRTRITARRGPVQKDCRRSRALRPRATSLPEAERVLIDGILANRVGDLAKTREAATRLTQLAPNDPRGHYLLGVRLLTDRKYAESVAVAAARHRAQSEGGRCAEHARDMPPCGRATPTAPLRRLPSTPAHCRTNRMLRTRLARRSWRQDGLPKRKRRSARRWNCLRSSGTPGTGSPIRSSTRGIWRRRAMR